MKIVKESIDEKYNDNIVISAGLVIIQNNKILLVHLTNSKYWYTYSIPKGQLNDTETSLEAAIRETEEEIGIKISVFDIDFDKQGTIDYKNKNGIIYKKIHYFVVYPKDEIIIDKYKLQLEEVSWAGFIDKKEAEKRINPKLKEVLKYLK